MSICSIYLYLLLHFSGIMVHPVHYSTINVEYKQEENKFLITFRLFREDLKQAILSDNTINLKDTTDLMSNKKTLNKYLLRSFEIRLNDKKVRLNYLHHTQKENEIWLFYAYKTGSMPTSISITNTIFTEIFADQTNLLIFTSKAMEKGIKFDKHNFSNTIYLDKESTLKQAVN